MSQNRSQKVLFWRRRVNSIDATSMVNAQVFQVATREFLVGDNLDLAVTLLRDDDGIAKVASAAVNLNAVV